MKAGGDFENMVVIRKVELERLRAVEAYAGPRLEALRFYANRKNWNPVADYADGYWYIAGQPWMLALAALKDTGVDVDQTAPTDVPDPLDVGPQKGVEMLREAVSKFGEPRCPACERPDSKCGCNPVDLRRIFREYRGAVMAEDDARVVPRLIPADRKVDTTNPSDSDLCDVAALIEREVVKKTIAETYAMIRDSGFAESFKGPFETAIEELEYRLLEAWGEQAGNAGPKYPDEIVAPEERCSSWLCKCGGEVANSLDRCCFCHRERAASEV